MRPRSHAHLDRTNTVLVVLDLQEPFLRSINDPERLFQGCQLLISAANLLEIPIITTVQYAERMGRLVPEIATLLPDDGRHSIDKLTFSAAACQPFLDQLMSHGREQVLICGVETHICVSQTALDLHHLDYQVHVAADAVSSRTLERHKLGMEKMRDCGIIPCCAEGAVMEMVFKAGTQDFKSVLKLIK